MSKYDCRKTLDYAHERDRMCNASSIIDCDNCPLRDVGGNCYNTRYITQEHIDIVQKWSDEHPEKAYNCSDVSVRWIPVSERLPKNDDWVIISIRDDSGDNVFCRSDFGWYLEEAKCWIVDSEQRRDIIAWMPLPEPFEEEENDSEKTD